MNKLFSYLAIAAVFTTGCASCQKTKSEQSIKTDQGYVSGKVTNSQGQPMAGVQVYISSDVWFNSGSQSTSDANGNYKIKIPAINSLRAYARTLVTYNNRQYLVNLTPDHPQSFTSEDAVTC